MQVAWNTASKQNKQWKLYPFGSAPWRNSALILPSVQGFGDSQTPKKRLPTSKNITKDIAPSGYAQQKFVIIPQRKLL